MWLGSVARQWGYTGGNDYTPSKAIAEKAQQQGYNVITFQSERGTGTNSAIFSDFDKILQPQTVVPTKP
jgi:hypothetical protein